MQRKESSIRPKADLGPGGAENSASSREKPGTAGENAERNEEKKRQPEKKPEKASALLLSRSDWLLIRHAVVVEGMTISQAGRHFNMHAPTIRARAKQERWHDIDQIRQMPTTEEIIIMRNQREIMRTLKVMSGKLEAAMQSGNADEAKLAAEKAELLVKYARANQSLARASEVAAQSKRRVKAHEQPKAKPEDDREALARQLLEIDAKVERAKLPEQSEHG